MGSWLLNKRKQSQTSLLQSPQISFSNSSSPLLKFSTLYSPHLNNKSRGTEPLKNRKGQDIVTFKLRRQAKGTQIRSQISTSGFIYISDTVLNFGLWSSKSKKANAVCILSFAPEATGNGITSPDTGLWKFQHPVLNLFTQKTVWAIQIYSQERTLSRDKIWNQRRDTFFKKIPPGVSMSKYLPACFFLLLMSLFLVQAALLLPVKLRKTLRDSGALPTIFF